MGPREYAIREEKDAAHQIGRYEGKRDAYEEMARHLDPVRYCQDCGQDYKEPGSHWGKTREEHEPECQQRNDRIAAERKAYFEQFLLEQSKNEKTP
ncbi:MAG: hypothetical protein V1767_00665 [Chloroflexota bacterium]